jgi:hypothetical protein
MLSAVDRGMNKRLRKKGWSLIGDYELQKDYYLNAIIAYNSSRMQDPTDKNTLY